MNEETLFDKCNLIEFSLIDLCEITADDSLLYRQVRNQTHSNDLQKDLSALEEWESKWQMSFHPLLTSYRKKKKKKRYKLHTLCITE
jgi:hypothetical protein